MHSSPHSPVGPRRRTTHPWVQAADRLARLLITLGGIGTIIAVLACGGVSPRRGTAAFHPARIAFDRETPLPDGPGPLCAIGTDDVGRRGLDARRRGSHGCTPCSAPADGAALLEKSARRRRASPERRPSACPGHAPGGGGLRGRLVPDRPARPRVGISARRPICRPGSAARASGRRRPPATR